MAKQLRIEVGFGVEFDREHRPVENLDEKLHRVKNAAVTEFGGYTFYDAQGGWRHADGQLAVERGGTVLTFQADEPGVREKISRFAAFVKLVLNQESVVVGITATEFIFA